MVNNLKNKENLYHQVLYGKLHIIVSANWLTIRKKGQVGSTEEKIQLPQIRAVSADRQNGKIFIWTDTETYSYYLGGFRTAQLLSQSIQNVINLLIQPDSHGELLSPSH